MGWGWGSLYSSAQRLSLAQCLQKGMGPQKSQDGVQEATSSRKPSESLVNPSSPLCPLVPSAGKVRLLSPGGRPGTGHDALV